MYEDKYDIAHPEVMYNMDGHTEAVLDDTMADSSIEAQKLESINGAYLDKIYEDTEESRIVEKELKELLRSYLLKNNNDSVSYSDELYE